MEEYEVKIAGLDDPEIPESLEAAYLDLHKRLCPEELSHVKNSPIERVVSLAHHGIGRWIRNNWGLWSQRGPLYEYFVSLGLWHADDMSGIILKGFVSYLQKVEFDIDKEVQHYLEYWEAQKKQEEPVLTNWDVIKKHHERKRKSIHLDIAVRNCDECPCCGQHPYDGGPTCLLTDEEKEVALGGDVLPERCPLRASVVTLRAVENGIKIPKIDQS